MQEKVLCSHVKEKNNCILDTSKNYQYYYEQYVLFIVSYWSNVE